MQTLRYSIDALRCVVQILSGKVQMFSSVVHISGTISLGMWYSYSGVL